MKYNRILLKLSGESLAGKEPGGIVLERLMAYCREIKEVSLTGVKTGVVIGGGNIFRGISGAKAGVDRIRGDYMGMLATVINALAIQSALEQMQVPTRLLTAIDMQPVTGRYSKQGMEEAFCRNEVVIFGFGTGNPFFTTDTTAALRGIEMEADVILKGTRVDGIYTADPEKDPSAVKYNTLTFNEAYDKNLKIMDLTAFTMCRENRIPILVFDMNKAGNLMKVVKGETIGTLVTWESA